MTIYFTNNPTQQTLELDSQLVSDLWKYASPNGIAPNSLVFKMLQSRGYVGAYYVYTALAKPSSMDFVCENEEMCDRVEEAIQGQVEPFPTNI